MLPLAGKKKNPPLFINADESGVLHPFVFHGNKIHFISLGCPRNLVDSEVMLGILLRAGYEHEDRLEEADYIVINSCGFLEASRNESMDTVQECLNARKKGAKLIVTGCMVQTHSESLKERFPGINYLLGSGDVEGILHAVQSTQDGQIITSAKSYLEAGEAPRKIFYAQPFCLFKKLLKDAVNDVPIALFRK